MINRSLATSLLATDSSPRTCILVVEDEWIIRMLLSDGLREEGYDVIEACDGDEAVSLLRARAPDLIISDVQMPGSLDGLGLLALVRQSHPTIPVIITSAHLGVDAALEHGAAQSVPKPYTMHRVIEAVQNELAKAS